jgi:hypothetical protein
MNCMKQYRCARITMMWLPLAALLVVQDRGLAVDIEETFEVLETKTGTYENVTVTSKTKDWIFILHAAGMGNVKILDLPEDVQLKLGYNLTKEQPKPASVPTMDALTDIKLPEVNQLRADWYSGGAPAVLKSLGNPIAVWTLLGIVGFMYLFFCYCSMMICRKTHTTPGFLIWVPMLQIIPLFRAAGMSGLWILVFFVPAISMVVPIPVTIQTFLLPVVMLITSIIWYVKIVKARGKNPLLVLWLLLPFTAPFAYLYLAFSSAAPVRIVSQHVPLALETA